MENTDDNTVDIESTAEEENAASRFNRAIVVDTTVIIAVVTNEPTKKQLIEATLGATLVAPTSLDVEVGNAFSRMFKRQRIELAIAERAVRAYQQIPIRLVDVDLASAVRLAYDLNIYAYDAYVIDCALRSNLPIISLDGGLLEACQRANLQIIQVKE